MENLEIVHLSKSLSPFKKQNKTKNISYTKEKKELSINIVVVKILPRPLFFCLWHLNLELTFRLTALCSMSWLALIVHYFSFMLMVIFLLSFSGVMSEQQFGTQFVCSVVASHVSHRPTTSLSFVWIAPPPGTGCINFL